MYAWTRLPKLCLARGERVAWLCSLLREGKARSRKHAVGYKGNKLRTSQITLRLGFHSKLTAWSIFWANPLVSWLAVLEPVLFCSCVSSLSPLLRTKSHFSLVSWATAEPVLKSVPEGCSLASREKSFCSGTATHPHDTGQPALLSASPTQSAGGWPVHVAAMKSRDCLLLVRGTKKYKSGTGTWASRDRNAVVFQQDASCSWQEEHVLCTSVVQQLTPIPQALTPICSPAHLYLGMAQLAALCAGRSGLRDP